MSRPYDPRSALIGRRNGILMMERQKRREAVPQGLVDATGESLPSTATETRPATCCVLLLAFMNQHPMVPEDFHNVPRTRKGIEEYVRPDGGVYLGAFELPKDPFGTVLVWGDPNMTREQAAAASLAYRQKVVEHAGLVHTDPRVPISAAH